MRGGDLAVFGLQNISVGALQYAGARAGKSLCSGEARGVFAELAAAAAGFDADHFHREVDEKLVEKTDGVRTAPDAGEKVRWQALVGGENLFAGFAAYDGLKITDHRGIGMRPEDGTEEVVGVADV